MHNIVNMENYTKHIDIETPRMRICSATEADIDVIIALESHPDNRDFLWIGTKGEHLQEIADSNHRLLIFRRRDSVELPNQVGQSGREKLNQNGQADAETVCDAKRLHQAGQADANKLNQNGQADAERPECTSANCAERPECTSANCAGQGCVTEAWGDVVGYALVRLDFKSEIFELRRIAIADKGRGYGKEAMKALLRLAFEGMNINRFWLDVYPDNADGIKLYEGLGMHRDGVLRQNYKAKRGYLDQIIYSMLKVEYEEIKVSSSYSEMEAKHEG